MATRVFNPGDTPLVIDSEGHTLAGREWAELEQTDELQAHVDAGRVVVDDSQPPPKKSAAAARGQE